MYDWIPNTPLERFLQNDPRKELAIAPVKKCFAFTTNKLAVSSTTETSLENRIFVVFLIEGHEYATLRKQKELLIAPFVQHFKTTTCGMPY